MMMIVIIKSREFFKVLITNKCSFLIMGNNLSAPHKPMMINNGRPLLFSIAACSSHGCTGHLDKGTK